MNNGGLRYQYARLSIAEKLIAINVAVFIVVNLLNFFLKLGGDNIVEKWFWLPEDFFDFLKQPWSIVTYSFLHGGIRHIFFNMLLLYFSGRILLNLFGPKRFLNVYFLGVIIGGLVFLLSYNVFPVFAGSRNILLGASAGVMAVLIFVATYIPNREIRLIFFNVKLWHIALFFILMDLIQIPTSNPGGHLAHLGGALLGYTYARQLTKGRDIGEGFSKLMDGLANLFRKKEKKPPLKTVYRNQKRNVRSTPNYDKENHQRKVDVILDKISKSGYESLSKAEKDFLFKAGKED